MKIFVFLLPLLQILLSACDGDCPSTVDNRVRVISNIMLDSIISPATFEKRCSESECHAEGMIKNLNMDSIPVNIVAGSDTLLYLLAYDEMSDIYIIVDSVATDCESSHSLSGRGLNHYRVDSGSIYSCVFYYEPSCP